MSSSPIDAMYEEKTKIEIEKIIKVIIEYLNLPETNQYVQDVKPFIFELLRREMKRMGYKVARRVVVRPKNSPPPRSKTISMVVRK